MYTIVVAEISKIIDRDTRTWLIRLEIDQLTKISKFELPTTNCNTGRVLKRGGEAQITITTQILYAGHMLCWFLLLINSIRKYHNKNEAEMDVRLNESKTCLSP